MHDAPPPPPVSPSLQRTLIVLMWLLWSVMWVRYAVWLPLEGYGIDYIKHRYAAEDILAGKNPYEGRGYLRFNYPEFTAWIFLFLAWLPEGGADEDVWDILNALFIAIALVAVIRGCRPRAPDGEATDAATRTRRWVVQHWHAVAALVMGLFVPSFVGTNCANIEPFNLMLVALLLTALMQGRDTAAGLWLAALALVKILPVLFLVPLWIGRRRRTVWVALGVFAVYGTILLATGWWRREWYLVTQVLPNLGFFYRGISNALATTFVQHVMPEAWDNKAIYDLVSRVGTGLAFGISGVILAWGRHGTRTSWRDGLSFVSLSIVLLPPLLEYIHLIWALPAYVLLVVDWTEGRLKTRTLALAGLLWGLAFVCRWMQELSRITEPIMPRQVSTFFLVALWAMAATRLLRATREK